MGVITFFGGVVVTVFVAIASRLGSEEVKAWTPAVIERLLMKAVAKLPEDERERMEEEWRADLEQWPGDLTRLWRTIGFGSAALKRAEFRNPSPHRQFRRRRPSRLDPYITGAQFLLMACSTLYGSYALLFKQLTRLDHAMMLNLTVSTSIGWVGMFASAAYSAWKDNRKKRTAKEPAV